jgi:glycine dehydrogenase subunit 1
MALRATVYLALLGPQGLREAAELSCRRAHYAAEQLTRTGVAELMFDRPFFKEFVLKCTDGTDRLTVPAREAGFDLGPELFRLDPDRADGLLVAVTEKRTRDQIDRLVEAIVSYQWTETAADLSSVP